MHVNVDVPVCAQHFIRCSFTHNQIHNSYRPAHVVLIMNIAAPAAEGN
jgi:hypothetical protein